MKFDVSIFLWGAPLITLLGGYLLICCIGRLHRLILPDVRQRWSDTSRAEVVALPGVGRYVINIVIPPLTVFTGTAYFSVRFAVVARRSGQLVPYRSFGRFDIFSVRRTDIRGHTCSPLGAFHCSEPGEYEITCLNPDSIRPDYQLEVSPYISPATFVPLILATLLGAGMALGGLVFTLLKLTGTP